MATGLNKTFFPGAKLEPAPRLADRSDVKVVLGHDLGPNNRPKPRRFMGRGSKGLSLPGTAAGASPMNRIQTETGSYLALIML